MMCYNCSAVRLILKCTLFFFFILKASTQTEAVLLESESESTSVELYLTVGNIKVNFNPGYYWHHSGYVSHFCFLLVYCDVYLHCLMQLIRISIFMLRETNL